MRAGRRAHLSVVAALDSVGWAGLERAKNGPEEGGPLGVVELAKLAADTLRERLAVALRARLFEGHVSEVGVRPRVRVRVPTFAVSPNVPPSACVCKRVPKHLPNSQILLIIMYNVGTNLSSRRMCILSSLHIR